MLARLPTPIRPILLAAALALWLFALPDGAAAQQATASPTPSPTPPPFGITRLADDVYVASTGGYNSFIVLTSDGVVVADPIGGGGNPQAPALIKQAIANLTDQPVKYVVYSPDTADHSTGGAVFADTAQFVAQKNAAPKIAARNDARSPVPTITFDKQMPLDLGGTHLELYVPGGRNHTDNNIVLYYPARKILFAVDFVPINRLPFRTLAGDYPDEWVDSLRWTDANLDFTTLVPGHGALGTKDNVRADRDYWLDLFTAIRGARLLGHADASSFMNDYVRLQMAPKYRTWENFDTWLPQNVQGVTKYWSTPKQ
jgi:glyoxylase-like metal-dependent hydrolase (beta-lactamase superfamily II)